MPKSTLLSYKSAFFATLTAFLLLAIVCAYLAQRNVVVQGFLVVQNSEGQLLSVAKIAQHSSVYTKAQLRSDLANYVVARMSYTAKNKHDMQRWQRYMNWHSSDDVYNAFIRTQSSDRGFLNTLGWSGTAKAHVIAISFVGKTKKGNPSAALVDVAQTVVDKVGQSVTHHYRVTMAWLYTGTPQDATIALNNWSGFEVTNYDVTVLS